MTNWRHLISELQRRNVLRAVVAYWVVAWTGIEVCSVIEQALLLPEWVDLVAVVLGIGGLVVVVAVSWIFEWGPGGLVVDDSPQQRWTQAAGRHELANRVANEVYLRLLHELEHSERTRAVFRQVR